MNVPVLVVTGPIGAGKTTVLGEVGDQLEAAGMPGATCDFDELTRSWPAPAGDRFNLQVGARNLAYVWANFAAAGTKRLTLVATDGRPVPEIAHEVLRAARWLA